MSTKRTKKHTRWGPSQREVLALLLIALGIVTLLGLLSITQGTLSDVWVHALRQIFGLGTYFIVFMFLAAGFFLLQRNLIYTAMTRGRQLVVMVGAKKALAMGIRNDKPRKRYTCLGYRLSG